MKVSKLVEELKELPQDEEVSIWLEQETDKLDEPQFLAPVEGTGACGCDEACYGVVIFVGEKKLLPREVVIGKKSLKEVEKEGGEKK